MYNLIDSTEEDQAEQLTTSQLDRPNEKGIRSMNSRNHNAKIIFCQYHKTNTYDKENCRALKREEFNQREKIKNRENKNQRCNALMKESQTKNQTLEIDVNIIKTSINSF
ncbi:hypothetical protein DMUE_0191 [Dictyocoela muelleri]|nr:hypothetical protein DMUE_0191 [Dictyocoela muelleri]